MNADRQAHNLLFFKFTLFGWPMPWTVCRAIKTKSWLRITCGVYSKEDTMAHTYRLVVISYLMARSSYETLYKGLMNINGWQLSALRNGLGLDGDRCMRDTPTQFKIIFFVLVKIHHSTNKIEFKDEKSLHTKWTGRLFWCSAGMNHWAKFAVNDSLSPF